MKISNRKLVHRILHMFPLSSNGCIHYAVRLFYDERTFKLCLTKQLLNMYKLWCEWDRYVQLYIGFTHPCQDCNI